MDQKNTKFDPNGVIMPIFFEKITKVAQWLGALPADLHGL